MHLGWRKILKIFDLHCDTLKRAIDENKSLFSKDFYIDIEKGLKYENWVQCFAIFIPDEFRGEKAFDLFKKASKKLKTECKNYNLKIKLCEDFKKIDLSQKNRCEAIFTVEGGAVLAGRLSNLDYLHNCGVKMMTLTWNGNCELGDGIGVENPKGLTEFGFEAIKKMEKLKIIIDVSHASDALFYDVAENTHLPFVASHSNSRTVCNNKRNLTDDQFKIVVKRGGIVGINFCKYFLNSKNEANIYDIIKHVDYFLSLGGEKNISLGSDFDGADMPDGIVGIESMEKLYETFLKCGYKEDLVRDVFFNNAYNFFKSFWG